MLMWALKHKCQEQCEGGLTCSQQEVTAIDAGVVVKGPTSGSDEPNVGLGTQDAG